MEMTSTIVCPACGHRESEIMPEDACQYFYRCKGCGVVMKPKKGDAGSRITSTPAWDWLVGRFNLMSVMERPD